MGGIDDTTYYAQLAEGALYLAQQSRSASDRSTHLAAADRYATLSRGEPYPPLRARAA